MLAIRLYSRLAHLYWFHRGTVPSLWAHLRELNLAERYPPTPELAQEAHGGGAHRGAVVLELGAQAFHQAVVAHAREALQEQRRHRSLALGLEGVDERAR